jgi:hypothetical protein
MSSRFKSAVSWHIWAIFGLGAVLGISLGCLLGYWVYIEQSTATGVELVRQGARVKLLEAMIVRQSAHDISALDKPPAPPEVAVESAAPVATPEPQKPAQGPAQKPTQEIAPARKSAIAVSPAKRAEPSVAVQTRPPAKPTQVASAAEPKQPAAPTEDAPKVVPPAVTVSPPKAEPVTPAELAAASAVRLEGVSSERAGVLRIERDGVVLKNGSVVRPGERFPSGEKLLQVDPENARVITNERQMLLFNQK